MTSIDERRDEEHEDGPEADAWLDALLDEVLGGQGPPDLKQQILARWSTQAPSHVPPASDSPSPPPFVVVPAARRSRRVRQPRRLSPVWTAVASACLLAVLTTGLIYWRTRPGPHHSSVVLGPSQSPTAKPNRPINPQPRLPAPDPSEALLDDSDTPGAWDPADVDAESDESSSPTIEGAADETPATDATPPATRLANGSIIDLINEHLRERWKNRQVVPAQAIADAGWCARAYRQLVGREPRSQEQRAFLAEPAAERRAWLVDRLLGPQHAQELAEYWSQNLTDWCLRGVEGESRAFRTGLQTHLANAIAAGRPFDEIYNDLISATGNNDPGTAGFNGATNYLLALLEREAPPELASQVCRATLGQRVSCAACHDNRQGLLPQQDFWQITATLNSVQVDVLRPGRARLHDKQADAYAGLSFRNTQGQLVRAVPGGLDGRPLQTSGERSLRAQLADQMVSSTDFSRATVNRFWESLLQYGFTLPVDDMGRHNPVSHPELVELLSQQFELHRYEIRDLLRWIALSDAFDRSAVIMAANVNDAPAEGGEPLFSRYYYRPRLFSVASLGLDLLAAGQSPQVVYTDSERELEDLVSRRSRRYVDQNGSEDRESASDGMGQLLPGHYLTRIRALTVEDLTREQQFEHAYLMVLGRRPTPQEQARAAAIYRAAGDDAVTALERVVWILLNTRP